MKAIAILIAGLGVTIQSEAAVIFYDSFDYATGNLNGNGSWSDSTTSGNSEVLAAPGNLAVSGLANPVGGMVTFSGGGNSIQRSIASPQYATTYYSFAFQVGSLGHLDSSTGDYIAGLSSSSSTYGARLFLRVDPNDPSRFVLGVATGGGGSTAWAASSLSLNTTVFVVGQYVANSGTKNDTSALWINPDPSSFGANSAPSPTVTAGSGSSDLSQIAYFSIRPDTSTTVAVGAVSFDELRVGTAWVDVTPVPEPGQWGAVALFIIMGIVGLHHWQSRRSKAV